MALLAGADDLILVQARTRIVDGENIVVAVAVVAGGHIGGDVGLTESHRLAVVGFAIVGKAVLMALAATLITKSLEMRGGRLFDVVRAVAVGANRPLLIALQQ